MIMQKLVLFLYLSRLLPLFVSLSPCALLGVGCYYCHPQTDSTQRYVLLCHRKTMHLFHVQYCHLWSAFYNPSKLISHTQTQILSFFFLPCMNISHMPPVFVILPHYFSLFCPTVVIFQYCEVSAEIKKECVMLVWRFMKRAMLCRQCKSKTEGQRIKNNTLSGCTFLPLPGNGNGMVQLLCVHAPVPLSQWLAWLREAIEHPSVKMGITLRCSIPPGSSPSDLCHLTPPQPRMCLTPGETN